MLRAALSSRRRLREDVLVNDVRIHVYVGSCSIVRYVWRQPRTGIQVAHAQGDEDRGVPDTDMGDDHAALTSRPAGVRLGDRAAHRIGGYVHLGNQWDGIENAVANAAPGDIVLGCLCGHQPTSLLPITSQLFAYATRVRLHP